MCWCTSVLKCRRFIVFQLNIYPSCVTVLDVYEEQALLQYVNRLPGPPILQGLMPRLLRREVEVAISKLGLLYDQTYAWDIFLDMMVRVRSMRSTVDFPSLWSCFCFSSWLQRSQLLCTLPNADLPKPFTDTTRAILVDWLTQVHVSAMDANL